MRRKETSNDVKKSYQVQNKLMSKPSLEKKEFKLAKVLMPE